MQFDLDAAAMTADAWDFALVRGGQRFPVRQLTLAEFNAWAAGGQTTREQDTQILSALFVGEMKPDVAAWTDDERDAAFTAIGAYLNAWLEKKRQRIRAQVRAAMQQTTAGNSGRPSPPS